MPSDDNSGGDEFSAFLLVCGAGLSTALGAAIVFFPSLVKLTSKYTLAVSLGLSSGVMLYVSFAEIYVKSEDGFFDAGYDEDMSFVLATVCFFAGSLLMLGLDVLVHALSRPQEGHIVPPDALFAKEEESIDVLEKVRGSNDASPVLVDHAPKMESRRDNDWQEGDYVSHCVGCSADPVQELESWKQLAEKEIAVRENNATVMISNDRHDSSSSNNSIEDEVVRNKEKELPCNYTEAKMSTVGDDKLMKMGLNTALAIALHNFPEGLATFVAATDDPSVGAVLAIAIGIHNIPEGLCVALPIYYSTGNKTKAFFWALLSGVSEPIAALLGWAILAASFTDTMYAILFGIVAGMMVMISLKELIPTAHRYDKEDRVVTLSVLGGMGIMALSLVLFRL